MDIANASLQSWGLVGLLSRTIRSSELTSIGGKRTRLRWRWREFRFETLYSVPHLSFASPDVNSNGTLAIRAFIEEPRFQFCKLTKDKVLKDADRHGELVGWVCK